MDKAQILAEVIALSARPAPVGPEEFIVRDYAQEIGLGLSAAKRRLDQLVTAGKLTARAATNEQGHPCRAYRLVK
jgi:predicted ArsR family transcriptional regulator